MVGFKKGIKSGMYIPPDFAKVKWILTETFDSKGIPGIKYRSSWELKFMKFISFNNNIIKANSEGMKIKYFNPITNKIANYYMDFMIETKAGVVWLVEVKPKSQTLPPKPPKNNTDKSASNYEKAIKTYVINIAKWEATEKLCQENGWIFKIITEKELGL